MLKLYIDLGMNLQLLKLKEKLEIILVILFKIYGYRKPFLIWQWNP